MPSFVDPIVPITLSLNGRTGVTLFAPPWTDADDEDWQGFLGDGSKIVLLGTPSELDEWLEDHPDHDLADHPAWKAFYAKGLRGLRPTDEAHYDFDAVYEWAAAEADPVTVSALADAVDIAGRIGDCCEDGALRALLTGTPEYVLLVEGETSYHGKEGAGEWAKLGDVIAESWERALTRIESWLRWEGSSATPVDGPEDNSDKDAK